MRALGAARLGSATGSSVLGGSRSGERPILSLFASSATIGRHHVNTSDARDLEIALTDTVEQTASVKDKGPVSILGCVVERPIVSEKERNR